MSKTANLSFEIVDSSEESAKLVMHWRNDLETLKQSFHQSPKTWPEFFEEFKSRYVADPTVPCLFAVLNGERIGFLRFRRVVCETHPSKAAVDVSINVAPAHRGLGLGSIALKAMRPILQGLGITYLVADIKPGNISSERVFEKAGFHYIGDREYIVCDTGEKVIVRSFALNLIDSVSLGDSITIGDGNPCFIIAEAGSNWRMGTAKRDLAMGKALIDAAVEAGCDAVKFQTYRAETTYVEGAGEIEYLASSGIKESINDIFSDLAMPYELLPELAGYCKQNSIVFMSSAFSVRDFEEVNKFSTIHKIASYEITHVRLLEAAARVCKPLILSTGASREEDIEFAVSEFRRQGGAGLCLMQCTAKYPAPANTINLKTIAWMKKRFGVPVGLSDHSRNVSTIPSCAVSVGANLIEKHYTLSNDLPGPDHRFAVTCQELKEMVSCIRIAEQALGDGVKRVLPEEEELLYFAQRSIQAIEDIAPGQRLEEGKNFSILRPGKRTRGLNPRFVDKVNSSIAKYAISAGEGIMESDLEPLKI